MKLISLTLLVAMIALVLVAGTYAKYTSSATGTSSARVAKWSFKVGTSPDQVDIATTNSFTFNLFDTINDSDGTTETDVVAANGTDTIIAPGTTGSFNIVLTNDSEVTAKYALDYTVTNTANIPLEFSVDGGTTWTSTLTDVAADDTNTALAANGGTNSSSPVSVQWRWPYEVQDTGSNPATYAVRDASDTTLGIAGTAVLTVQVDITATQVD